MNNSEIQDKKVPLDNCGPLGSFERLLAIAQDPNHHGAVECFRQAERDANISPSYGEVLRRDVENARPGAERAEYLTWLRDIRNGNPESALVDWKMRRARALAGKYGFPIEELDTAVSDGEKNRPKSFFSKLLDKIYL